MKLLLLLTFLMLTPVLQEQLDDQRDPRLVVLKFSWAKERQISEFNRLFPILGHQRTNRCLSTRQGILKVTLETNET